jgi:SAM-dependent methyltransferase
MEDPAWAFGAFHRHFDNVDFRNKRGGFTMLELGPGDSLVSALIARAYGASGSVLLDVGPFAHTDVRHYQASAKFLRSKGLNAPDLSHADTIDDVLAACNARYETHGLESLRRLPTASFDFVFSNGVIQSVWRHELAETLREMRRVVHPLGSTIHSLDLTDTLNRSLNHLRFSEKTWESDWFRRAAFYTNRYRLSELMRVAREAGFEPQLDEVNRWEKLPLPRGKLDAAFRSMSDDDLLVATIRLILRPASPAVEVTTHAGGAVQNVEPAEPAAEVTYGGTAPLNVDLGEPRDATDPADEVMA